MRKDPFQTNNVVADLKKQLKQTRAELHEADAKYPHIQKVVDEHWND